MFGIQILHPGFVIQVCDSGLDQVWDSSLGFRFGIPFEESGLGYGFGILVCDSGLGSVFGFRCGIQV